MLKHSTTPFCQGEAFAYLQNVSEHHQKLTTAIFGVAKLPYIRSIQSSYSLFLSVFHTSIFR